MSESDAGGRKAQMPRDSTGETENHLNQQIAAMTAHLAFCLERSKDITHSEDPYGHARGGEVGRAISLAKVSAKVAMAIGRMQGELSYNFNYNHNQGDAAGPPRGPALAGTRAGADLRLVSMNDLPRTAEGRAEHERRYKELYHSNWTPEESRGEIEYESRHRPEDENWAAAPPSPESSRFE